MVMTAMLIKTKAMRISRAAITTMMVVREVMMKMTLHGVTDDKSEVEDGTASDGRWSFVPWVQDLGRLGHFHFFGNHLKKTLIESRIRD